MIRVLATLTMLALFALALPNAQSPSEAPAASAAQIVVPPELQLDALPSCTARQALAGQCWPYPTPAPTATPVLPTPTATLIPPKPTPTATRPPCPPLLGC